jgi:predicted NAD-dependent protein-ADP-ribosyltransferase YbiA (DUF1768 family)
MSRATMLRWFNNRIDFIEKESDRILEVSRSSSSLSEFDDMLSKLKIYIHDTEVLEGAMKTVKVQDDALLQKGKTIEQKLKKNVLPLVQKRYNVLLRTQTILNESTKNTTHKIVKLDEKERIRLEKEQEKERLRLEKEQEKERLRLEKEQEKERIRLEKEAAKMQKQDTKKISKKTEVSDEQYIKDHVATFVFKKMEFQSLSNFWPCQVIIMDEGNMYEYNCGESAFHGEKYRRLAKESKNPTRSKELMEYSVQFTSPTITALESKKKGGKSGLALTGSELERWNTLSVEVQREISWWKVNHNDQVRTDLLNTGNRILVHSAMRTSEKDLPKKIWEGKAILNEKGEILVLGGNWLGKVWMEVRDAISK